MRKERKESITTKKAVVRPRLAAFEAFEREFGARLLASPLTIAVLSTRGLRTFCTPCHGRGVTL